MSYNWVDASTKQGLERFKELGDMKLAVITRSGDGTLSECFCEPDGTIVINQVGYEDWEDAEENNAFFSLEFLDPSPAPVAVADENGLLPCPFCGGKGNVYRENEVIANTLEKLYEKTSDPNTESILALEPNNNSQTIVKDEELKNAEEENTDDLPF